MFKRIAKKILITLVVVTAAMASFRFIFMPLWLKGRILTPSEVSRLSKYHILPGNVHIKIIGTFCYSPNCPDGSNIGVVDNDSYKVDLKTKHWIWPSLIEAAREKHNAHFFKDGDEYQFEAYFHPAGFNSGDSVVITDAIKIGK